MKSTRVRKCRQRWLGALAVLALTACAGPTERADRLVRAEAWHEAVVELRKAAREHPADVEVRSRLAQTELRAAEHFHARAMQLLAQGDPGAAIDALQSGLSASPAHEKLHQALASLLAQQEADSLHEEGQRLHALGSTALAMARWEQALQRMPGHAGVLQALAEAREAGQGQADGLALGSRAPVTLNFRQTDLRAAFEFLSKAFGINVIFDEGLRSAPVTLLARDVTFEQGLGLLLSTSRTFYKRLGPNTILVASDTKEKRGQYEDHLVRTLHLNTIRAKEMADILKGLVTVRKLVVNEPANAILVRDTQEVIRVIERIVDASDRKPAELLLEVEILEVNRSKSEKLGLDFGSYALTAGLPSPSTVPIGTSIGSAFRSQGMVTVPSVTLRLFKQDVDAKTLANPRVRVVSGKLARIHIGDRVPLRAATIVDATGQTRTTFDYREVGIKLQVEPTIHLDHSTLVKLGLEVSSLGENLGTASEPAFRIGTRNAETFMVLRDGETAILGGLIRDEERNTRVRIPGLGDVPLVGAAFTSFDDATGRTDVLLTITPRIVRGWEPALAGREFYSGSEQVVSEKPMFAAFEHLPEPAPPSAAPAQVTSASPSPEPLPARAAPTPVGVAQPEPSAASATAQAKLPPAHTPVQVSQGAAVPITPLPNERSARLRLSTATHEVRVGEEITLTVQGQNLGSLADRPLELLFNPQLLAPVSAEGGVEGARVDVDPAAGLARLTLSPSAASSVGGQEAVIARVVLRAQKSGLSYLVFRPPAGVPSGALRLEPSRIVIP